MDNHYHIVIETIDGILSKGMRQLNGVYTQYLNRRHGRAGHVFQGRFKGILVEKDTYLLELARYGVLNPIRARMVNDIDEYRWSSYLATIGKSDAPSGLETDWLLSQFSKQKKRAVTKHENFVHEGIGLPPIWGNLSNQFFFEAIRSSNNFRMIFCKIRTLMKYPGYRNQTGKIAFFLQTQL